MSSNNSHGDDNFNFEIYFAQTKKVAGELDEQAGRLTHLKDELIDIANNLTGSGSIVAIGSAVRDFASDVQFHSERIRLESQVILDCARFYENAEAELLGEKVVDTPTGSGGNGRGGSYPEPQPQKPNSKGGKKEEMPKSGWVSDIDYIDKNGKVTHYKKAYIDSDGNVTSYMGKTSWKSSFLSDYNVTGGKVLLKNSVKLDRKVYQQGKGWIKAADQEGIAKTMLPLLEKEIVSLEGEATLFGAQKSGENSWGKYDASAKFLTAQGSVDVGVGAYVFRNPDGSLSTGVGLNATAAASAAVVALSASGFLGNTKAGAGVMGEAQTKVLSAEAAGQASIGWVEGKGPQIAATGSVGANLVEAKGSAGLALAKGLSAKATGSVSIGVGATASIGYSGGKFHCELGAALGIGFKISIDVDLSGAVDAITGAAKSVYSSFWDYIESVVGEDLANQAKKTMEESVKDSVIYKIGEGFVKIGEYVAEGVKKVFSGW